MHVHTNFLWVHDANEHTVVQYGKVAGSENGSGSFTEHLPYDTMDFLLPRLGLQLMEGQDETAYTLDNVQAQRRRTQLMSVDANKLIEKVQRGLEMVGVGGGTLKAWHRANEQARTFKSSMKGGPEWRSVKFRATCKLQGDGVTVEDLSKVSRKDEHRPLPWSQEGICTFLRYWSYIGVFA